MPLRRLSMPNDADILLAILPDAFQYPNHPEWNINANEKETLANVIRSLKQTWWLNQIVGIFWPPARDVMHGAIWEADGQAVGIGTVSRLGTTDRWLIENVAVLPDYRRQGIGRTLVEECMAIAHQQGARYLKLEVTAGNNPALALYQSLGFTRYMTNTEYAYTGGSLDHHSLPDGYSLAAVSYRDWETRYTLANQFTPEDVQVYDPITKDEYHDPWFIRLVQPVLAWLMDVQTHFVEIQDRDGQAVGYAGYRTEEHGHTLTLRLDPAHATVAQSVLTLLVNDIRAVEADQGHSQADIDMVLPDWQKANGAIDPTVLGFEEGLRYWVLGIRLAG